MTEQLLVKDFQQLDPGSELVQLFEIEYSLGNFIYVHPGLDDDLSTLQFRDYDTNATVRTYTAIPMMIDGFESKADGAISRPTITIGVAETTFSGAIGTIDYDTLVGLKIVRRLTLKKYLYGETSDASPPVEFPRQVWYIDRIKSRKKTEVTFECTSPFDIQGIKIPGRVIVPNRCPFVYQGASTHVDEWKRTHEGCTWDIEGKHKAAYSLSLTGKYEYTVYVNTDDEYIVPSTTSFTTWASNLTLAANGYYKTTQTETRFNAAGTTSTATVTNYWQSVGAGAAGGYGTPTDANSNFKRIRIYTTYNHGTEYFTYTTDNYNDYVLFTDNVSGSATNGKTLLWKARAPSKSVAPTFNSYWERGDACSKTTDGCKMRFGFNPTTITSNNSTGAAKPSTEAIIPFGGFPGAKAFS